MARIDYSISVTPIQSTTLEGQTLEVVDQEVGRSLGGGNSSLTWAGNDVDAWAGGVYTNIEATTSPTAVGASGDNGVWIKHTGKDFADSSVANTDIVTVKLASTALCTLGSGDCIFIPNPQGTINITGADDTGPIVEYCKLT